MPIVKCKQCWAIALDTTKEGKHTVQCHGCGTWYEIEIEGNQLKKMTKLDKQAS